MGTHKVKPKILYKRKQVALRADIFLTLDRECEIQIIKQCEALGGEVYCLQYKVITHIHHSGYKWKSFPSSRQAVK